MLDKAELLKAYIFDSTVSSFARKFLKQLDLFLIRQIRKDYKCKYLDATETHVMISVSIKDNKAFMLGSFELLMHKSPYKAAGNNHKYCTWFDTYTSVVKEIKEKEFVVAILDCGIYDYPLLAEIKKVGKVALQMCGEIQIIIGRTGKRWEDGEFIDKYKNEYCIYPIAERHPNFENVEGGCYL